MTGAVIGFDVAATRLLATTLGLPLEAVAAPDVSVDDAMRWTFADAIDHAAWTAAAGTDLDRAVICTWRDPSPAVALVDVDPATWITDVEMQLGLWYQIAVAVADRCVDGASVVIVVERPAPIDVDGRGTVTAVAEGLSTLGRCIALVHGARRVRVNTVCSQLATAPTRLFGMAPPLPDFPGDVHGVAGAVQLLLAEGSAAVTGTLVRADYGRSW